MDETDFKKPSIRQFQGIRRNRVSVSREQLVKAELLSPDESLPLLIQPLIEGVTLAAWVAHNQEFIGQQLLKSGAILFRNFAVRDASDFEQIMNALSGELLAYIYRSTPRQTVNNKIYTSTEYPPDELITLHNENAYTSTWPMKIWFFCAHPAEHGGETLIADSRKVYLRIDPKIRERFAQKKVLYVRNYSDTLDLPWQTVFQTHNRSEVESYCRNNSISFEWKGNDSLRTTQVCQAVVSHPQTGESVWFNQAHLFHISSLKPEVRDYLLSTFKSDDLPRNAYYGDGTPIEESVLDEIREIYQQESIGFPWQKSDLLLLDNMLTAHGRNPYKGHRSILVGMAEPMSAAHR